jgi:site-specific recombinase XerD
MTRQRKMMLEELPRRNYSPGTIRCYLSAVADFARYFHRPPDQLRPQHIREYQAYLFRERKLDATSVTQKLAALRFFFIKTLRKPWSVAETPYPKQVRRLPLVLSQEEVARLINSARNPFDQVLLMTLYATGARCAEVARLQVGDIDSSRMIVPIRGGKGREDRDVMLSPVLLEALREHGSRIKPKVWLFPAGHRHSATQPLNTKTVWRACPLAVQRAG